MGIFSLAIGVVLGYVFRDKISDFLDRRKGRDRDEDIFR